MTTRTVAVDARGVSHAPILEPFMNALTHPGELVTACGTTARWRHLTSWWSPLVMTMAPGQVDCMACLVAEARQ